MAKSPKDSDEITRRGKSRAGTSILAFVMLGMIVIGLGGYGVTNFGNSVDSVATVGQARVTTNDYARALRSGIARFSEQFGQQLSLKQAQMFGIDAQVLQGLVNDAALDNEAQRLGLSANDQRVAQSIATTRAFFDVTGKFDRTQYAQVLQQNGITVKDFESGLRRDLSRQVLQAAVVGGIQAPAALTQAIEAYQAETRSFTLLQLTESSLPAKLPQPSPSDLQKFYTDHIAEFTRPEAKRVSYALLEPADVAADQAVEEAAIKAAYDAQAASYNVPEKRLVERLVYPSEDEAKAARAKLDAGTSFEDLVKARGLELTDIDLGDVTREDLGQAAAEVFGLTQPGVVGPLPSSLGPALYRMNAILPAQVTTLDEAHDKIKSDLQLKAAVTAIAGRNEAIDDLLAGGASVADVAKDQGMKTGTTDFAKGASDNDPVTQDPAFVKAVEAMQPGDFAQSFGLSDGGMMVAQVTETVAPTPLPFDKVQDKVSSAFHAQALSAALSALADADLTAVKAGARLETLGITDHVPATTRSATPDGIPAAALATAFTLQPGDQVKIDQAGTVAILRLDSITPADLTTDKAKATLATLTTQASQAMAQDSYDLFSAAMVAQGGLQIDQAAITAVQARMN